MVGTIFRGRRPEGAPRCAGLSTWLSPAPPWPGSMSATGSTRRTSPPTRQREKTRPRRDSAALRPLAMMQTDGRLIESFRLSAVKRLESPQPQFSFFLEDGPTERGRTALALLDRGRGP